MSDEILWRPSEESAQESRLGQWMQQMGLNDYASMHLWSIQENEEFWKQCMQKFSIIGSGDLEPVYIPDGQGRFFGGRWFPKFSLNYAQNILEKMNQDLCVIHHEEGGIVKPWTGSEFIDSVRKIQSFLEDRGVKPGDVVAGIVSNRPEAMMIMLAATSLGAVWSSCSPEFGVNGILDRLSQVKPKILFLQKTYKYNGKVFSLRDKNDEVLEALDTVESTLTVDGADFDALLESDRSHQLRFVNVGFGDPLYVLFSSGTTGKPKCIVHSVGGSLLQHAKELLLHCDLKAGEHFAYYTTTGWMMWNWMLSGLMTGAIVHTYDGAPFLKSGWNLFTWADQAGLDVFGTSARFIGASRSQNIKPYTKDSRYRLLLSTGSPLLPEDFDYLYEHATEEFRPQVASISGGTDIVSCFMLGNPVSPVRRGQIQAAGLGMDVAAFSDNGERLIGECGELVCCKAFPSMPLGFLNDEDQERFQDAYFNRFAGVWHHGDYVSVMKEGGIVIHGRSDSTLNPGGVRIGTAEIYRQVESIEEISDSLVVGKTVDSDEKVVLFVLLKEGVSLDAGLQEKIKTKIKTEASPRHVPWKIFECSEIPYTLSGKKVEVAVKKLLAGQEVKNAEALSNPKSLDFYRNFKIS